jgi:hypothetical protein
MIDTDLSHEATFMFNPERSTLAAQCTFYVNRRLATIPAGSIKGKHHEQTLEL